MREFFEFFDPSLALLIDFTVMPEAELDKQLYPLEADSSRGSVRPDIFFKLHLINDKSRLLIFFIEQQEKKDPRLAARCHISHNRLIELYPNQLYGGLVICTGHIVEGKYLLDKPIHYGILNPFLIKTFSPGSFTLEKLEESSLLFSSIMYAVILKFEANERHAGLEKDNAGLKKANAELEKAAETFLRHLKRKNFSEEDKVFCAKFAWGFFKIWENNFNLKLREEYKMLISKVVEDLDVQLARVEGLEVGWEKGLAEGLEKGQQKGLAEGLEKGQQKGLAEGLEKGLAEGERKNALEVARKMLAADMPVEKIADFSGLSEDDVLNLRDGIRKD
ncbi:MAG: hypothetical protein LBR53_09355 [Deltaproteobacteria bacterium]|nr:hypothetical protein [Deltaproteobacteria bacterium]